MLLFGCTGALALPAQNNPISADARQSYALVKDSLLKAAEKMPAEDYSFRTAPQVRTFGEMIAHVADGQLLMCQVVKGEKTTAMHPLHLHLLPLPGRMSLAQQKLSQP